MQDVSLFLDSALGVTCKFLECPSGEDVVSSARTLACHTPSTKCAMMSIKFECLNYQMFQEVVDRSIEAVGVLEHEMILERVKYLEVKRSQDT